MVIEYDISSSPQSHRICQDVLRCKPLTFRAYKANNDAGVSENLGGGVPFLPGKVTIIRIIILGSIYGNSHGAAFDVFFCWCEVIWWQAREDFLRLLHAPPDIPPFQYMMGCDRYSPKYIMVLKQEGSHSGEGMLLAWSGVSRIALANINQRKHHQTITVAFGSKSMVRKKFIAFHAATNTAVSS